MPKTDTPPYQAATAGTPGKKVRTAFIIAWICCMVFYFIQYAVRSAPSVMIDELQLAFGFSTVGLGSVLGLYYYTYSTFALVSGAALDRWGAKYTLPLGAACLALGITMFGLGIGWMAEVGRLLQGAGAAFAFTGAVYLAAHGLPARYLASAIGVTQCLGMLGGSAGQFAVAPLINGPMNWQSIWLYCGAATLVVAVVMWIVTPHQAASEHKSGSLLSIFSPYRIVLSNPQSWLAGLCAGLLFLPTTVGGMTWGVSFLTEGWHIEYAEAVNRAAMIPFGWVIGAPLLGFIADRIGRRKPVLLAGIVVMLVAQAAILYLPPDAAPHYLLAFALGVGSSAAMIPYTIIKEANPDNVKGSATGAMNFLVFIISALASPAIGWYLQKLAGDASLNLSVFVHGGTVLGVMTAVAAVLAVFLRETGSAAHKTHA